MVGQVGIGSGIPDVLVYAVENAMQLVTERTQNAVETVTMSRGADLVGIVGADRSHLVGKHDARLEHGKVTEKFH